MDPKTGPSDSLKSDDLYQVLAEARESVDDVDFLDEDSIEKLTTVNARLDGEAAKALPESPWYLAILAAVVIGAFVGLIYLIR